MTLDVRPGTPADVPALHALYCASVRGLTTRHYTPQMIEAWVHALSPDDLRSEIQKGARFMVAEEGGRPLGFAARRKDQLWLLFVHPDVARRGVGRALCDAAAADARGAGYDRLELRASLNSVPFYRACGFVEGAEIEQLFSGVLVRSVRMARELGP